MPCRMASVDLRTGDRESRREEADLEDRTTVLVPRWVQIWF